jgi:hypothetical protein
VQSVAPMPKSELRRQLEGDIMCTCGCRSAMNDCRMGPTCHGLQEQNAKLDRFLSAGMNRDEVRAAFAEAAGGQHVLMAPIDKGFNRLAWLFPYLVGAFGALVIGLVARRWSHRDGGAPAGGETAPAPEDRNLTARLDDELRDLD